MPRRQDSDACGVLNIDKPLGITSHDVVGRVRRLLGTRRVGHAGTLDPAASGVLLVCVGPATRLAEFLVSTSKTYEGCVRLGVTTDSYDADGEVVTESPTEPFEPDAIHAALGRFTGDIEQVPPVFSAIKKDGVAAHRRARRGETVEMKPRPVRIDAIECLQYEHPDLRIRVSCQAGTYIRSLAHDVGQVLGCGAHLAALARTESGRWLVQDACTLNDIAKAVDENRRDKVLHPIEAAVAHLPSTRLETPQIECLIHGQPIELAGVDPCEHLCGLDSAGRLVAILRPGRGDEWRPSKVFRQPAAPSNRQSPPQPGDNALESRKARP